MFKEQNLLNQLPRVQKTVLSMDLRDLVFVLDQIMGKFAHMYRMKT